MINNSNDIRTTLTTSDISDNDSQEKRMLIDQYETETDVSKRSWVKRTFGPMEKGSVRGSIIALMSCAMGSGMLTYPSNAKNSGIIIAVSIIIICGGISKLMMSLLVQCSFRLKASSYAELVETSFGKFAKKLFEIDLILYSFGTIVCYQIMFATFLWEASVAFGVNEERETILKMIFYLAFMVLNLPISMLKDVYQLRYFAQLQLCVIAYVCLAIVVYFVHTYDGVKISNNIKVFDLNRDFFSSFATTMFGYICHQLVLPLRSELKRSSVKRMNKICARAVMLTLCCYLLLAITGYLTWLNITQSIIIDNYTNIYFTVAKMLLSFALFFCVPLTMNPMRFTLLECLNKKDSKKVFTISTIIIQVTSGVLAFVYPNVKSGFGFLGGFLGTNMVVVIPGLIYAKTFGWNARTIVVIVICAITALLGYTGAIMSQIYKD